MKKLVIFISIFILISINFTGCIKKEDSDGDGLPDNIEREGWDVRVFYPGQTNATVYHVSSNPYKRDTDGDGLSDYWEMMHGPTDPTKKDTDEDGLTDYQEEMIFHTNPLDWHDDIDDDNFPGWQGDYQEIEYYRKHGIDNKTILKYLQEPDVDGDGVKDGYDEDPLRDLKIRVNITGLRIWSMMDGPNDDILEIEINVSSSIAWHLFKLYPKLPIIVGKNYSLNLSCIIDLDDRGIPGHFNNTLLINVMDMDEGSEMKPFDSDGLPTIDIVKIYGGGVYLNENFNITKDCHSYHIKGKDGELWFSVSDASIPAKK